MAETKKKTVAKKTPSVSATSVPKKTPPVKKKTQPTKKKVVTNKTSLAPEKTSPAKKKSPGTKKAPSIAIAKTTAQKEVKKNKPLSKKIESKTVKVSIVPEQKLRDTGIFSTIVAIFVIILVVFGGYIYSQQKNRVSSPIQESVNQPQQISISESVELNPEVISTLEGLASQVVIGPDEVLQSVEKLSDITVKQSENPEFFARAQAGDFVFEFKSTSVLYRPTTREIIMAGIVSKQLK